MIYVAMYLVAIVAANLLVARFGPAVTAINALLFIGLDLTARDRLHDAWRRDRLWLRMAVLIAAGSALTVALNWGAWRVALASFAAFACAGAVDALVYHALGGRARIVRVNGSNVFSAAVDSAIFPLLAFGWPPLLLVMVGQFAAKVFGGFLWSLVLRR